jgi:hypothetical protein
MTMRALRVAAWGLLVSGLAPLGGCGPVDPPLYPVTGRVVLRDGRPIPSGVIEFAPDSGPHARAKIGPDGRFALSTDGRAGAVAGKHRVVVLQVAADGTSAYATKVAHPKYARFETSGLSREVKPGENDFLIALDPAAEKRGW